MSRYALEWAKQQAAGSTDAKLLLILFGDHAETWRHSARVLTDQLVAATGLNEDRLAECVTELNARHLTDAEPAITPAGSHAISFALLIPREWRPVRNLPRPSSHTPADAPTAVYRLYDADGALLYVGISATPEQRFEYHERTKVWWYEVVTREVVWHPTKHSADAEEFRAINTEEPKYNLRHADKDAAKPRQLRGRYVKWSDRSKAHDALVRQLRAEAQAGRYDVHPLPPAGVLASRHGVDDVIAAQAVRTLCNAGVFVESPGGVVYRSWSEW